MKKILITALAVLTVSSFVFAQEAAPEQAPAETVVETAAEETVVDAKAAAAAAKAAEKAAAAEAKKKAKEEAAAAKAAAAEAKKKAKEEAAAAKAAEKAAKAEAAKKAKEEAAAAKAAAAEAKKKAKEDAAAANAEGTEVAEPAANTADTAADPAAAEVEAVAEGEEKQAEEIEGLYVAGPVAMRIGGGINADIPAGDLADYLSAVIGGNILYEADFKLPAKIRAGASVHAGFGAGLPKGDVLSSCMNMRFTAGAFARIPVVKNVILQPELNYGVAVYLPKASDSEELKSSYTDQIVQIACAVRIANPKMLKNRLEIDVAPTYTLSTEDGAQGHFIGFRLGALYSFK